MIKCKLPFLFMIIYFALFFSSCATQRLNKQLAELDRLYHAGQMSEAEYLMKYQLIYQDINSRRSAVSAALSNAGSNLSNNSKSYTARPDGTGNYKITNY